MSAQRAKNEREFIQQYDPKRYSGPICSVDMVIFSVLDNRLNVLLIKRDLYPNKDVWALPGGIIDTAIDETIEATAKRKLEERTGVLAPYLEQVCTVGNRSRDPRHWSISVIYFALMNADDAKLNASAGASEARWFPVDAIGEDISLAFDHEKLLRLAVERLRNKVRYTMLPAYLLPDEFSLKELVDAYRAILGDVEQAMIRKRALRKGLVEETGRVRRGSNRPAKLYRIAAGAKDHFFVRNISG